MAILGFELEEIARVISILETRDLDELIYEEGGRTLRLRGPRKYIAVEYQENAPAHGIRTVAASALPHTRPAQSKAHHASASGAGTGELPTDQIALTAPMVGVFYRSDKPGGPPFVNVGERVALGQTIGLIEAMKVFSEVPAEHAGIVVAAPAHDGQLVQSGTPLVVLQRD